jgi:hypothetical protein
VLVALVETLAGDPEGEPGAAGLADLVERGGELGPGQPADDLVALASWK